MASSIASHAQGFNSLAYIPGANAIGGGYHTIIGPLGSNLYGHHQSMQFVMVAYQGTAAPVYTNKSDPFIYGIQGISGYGSNIPLLPAPPNSGGASSSKIAIVFEVLVLGAETADIGGGSGGKGACMLKTQPVTVWQDMNVANSYRVRAASGANVAFSSGTDLVILTQYYTNDFAYTDNLSLHMSNNGGSNIVLYMSNSLGGPPLRPIYYTANVNILSCCPAY